MRLVFLNGCSTGPQAAALQAAGINTVVATARPTEDALARDFAVTFYTQLVACRTFREAFEVAGAQVMAERGGTPRDLVPAGKFTTEDIADDFGFPSKLFVRDGARTIEEETLPRLAGNPLLGLPPAP